MTVESTVFGRHHRMNRIGRNRIKASPFTTFHKVFVGNLAVHVVDVGHEFRVDLLQLRKRRKLRREMVINSHHRDKRRNHRNSQNNQPFDHLAVSKPALKNTEHSQQNRFDFIHFCSAIKKFWEKIIIFRQGPLTKPRIMLYLGHQSSGCSPTG